MTAFQADRRELLRLASASSLGLSAAILNACASLTPSQAVAALGGRYPFALGVASGAPRPTSLVLWTRVSTGVPLPQAILPVRWQIARDERFSQVVASGTSDASPALGHSVHVEANHLAPASEYFYRFLLGDAISPVGRTRTAPTPTQSLARLRLVLGSCQHYEQGYFSAWSHAMKDNPDVVVFVGDYIYEYGPISGDAARGRPRRHDSPEVRTLDGYRQRYALYKSDKALQEAHQMCPWLLTWDDHEVSNDYANDRDERLDPKMLVRRAAAYQAYWENLPLPIASLDVAAAQHMRVYDRFAWGGLASIHMLDARQYRDYQACTGAGRGGSSTVWRDQCASLDDPKRSLLGREQEQWLDQGLSNDSARWTILGQSTLMAVQNQALGKDREQGRERYWTDGWNGYAPARERLYESLKKAQSQGHARDTLVLGGDVHSWNIANLSSSANGRLGENSPVLASEICGTSITSRSWPQEMSETLRKLHPQFRYARSDKRGYTLIELDEKRANVTLRAVNDVTKLESAAHTDARFVVERGKPGIEFA